MKYLISAILSLLFILPSCKKNTVEEPQDLSSAYLTMNKGDWWIYEMDSIKFHGTGAPPDTFNYYVRHKVTEELTVLGGIQYSIEIEYREDSISNWQFTRTYSINTNSIEVVRNDFDQNEVILSKPFSINKSWDGNMYNISPKALYYISELHQPSVVNGSTFDSTMTVSQEEQINLVNSYQGKEIFAKNVGLISREKERLSNLTDPNKVKGYKFKLSLLDFAK